MFGYLIFILLVLFQNNKIIKLIDIIKIEQARLIVVFVGFQKSVTSTLRKAFFKIPEVLAIGIGWV
jgi:hypothetical protein